VATSAHLPVAAACHLARARGRRRARTAAGGGRCWCRGRQWVVTGRRCRGWGCHRGRRRRRSAQGVPPVCS